jgi:cyclic pyranopterin monophosphate synthase
MTKKLTHIDNKGNAKMVDVAGKSIQLRTAIASGKIILKKETIELVKQNNIVKGDVITVAKIAGIQAAKRTSELIPLCHPLALTKVDLKFEINSDNIEVTSEVKCEGKTGVEMEALTAVNVALLTIYDMCKAVDKEMAFENVKLLEKTKVDL